MSDVSDGETLEIMCPACQTTTTKTVAWLKKHDRIIQIVLAARDSFPAAEDGARAERRRSPRALTVALTQ